MPEYQLIVISALWESSVAKNMIRGDFGEWTVEIIPQLSFS